MCMCGSAPQLRSLEPCSAAAGNVPPCGGPLPRRQVAELCEAASAEVPAGQGVRIANYLCNGALGLAQGAGLV